MIRASGTLALALLLAGGCAGARTQEEGVSRETLRDLERRFDFQGNESFDSARLWQSIAEDPSMFEQGIDRASVDDAAYQVEGFYRQEGYAFAQVSYEIIERDGETRALLTVSEGPRFEVGSIVLEGMSPEAREVVSVVLPEPGAPFVLQELEDALRLIDGAYFRTGFLRADLGDPEVTYDEERGRVHARLQVSEGIRFFLRSVRIEGERVLPEERYEAAYADVLGLPFTPRLGLGIRSTVLEAHRRAGWPDCTIEAEPRRDEETGDVELALLVDPGVRVTFGEVHVEGAEQNDEEFILGRLLFESGDVYDSDKVRASQGALFRTGLFQSARIELEEGEGEVRDAQVIVSEYATRDFFVEPGYGSYEGPRLGLGVNERSIFGSGRSLRFEGSASPKKLSFSTIFTDPYFMDERFILTVTQFNDIFERPSYTTRSIGGNVSLRRNWTEEFSTTLGYQFSFTELTDVDLKDPEDQDSVDDSHVAVFSGTVSYDTRDQVLMPTSGTRSALELDLASKVFGSSDDFVRSRVSGAAYYGPRDGTVLAGGVRLGVVVPYGRTDAVPLQERFFNGGENTVRAFEEDELGPRDSRNNPRGGEALSIFNVEVRQQLHEDLFGALFYDAGSVAFDHEDFFDFDDFGHGPGVGIHYFLPVGSIRLDLARNLDPGRGDDDWELHLAVGMAF